MNKSHYEDLDINIVDIFNAIYKNLLLIFSISVLCASIFYFYGNKKTKIYKTEIVLKLPTVSLFDHLYLLNENKQAHFEIEKKGESNTYHSEYIELFKENFLSIDNIESFLKSHKEFAGYINFLEKNNLTVKQVLTENFGTVEFRNQVVPNKYFLKYTNELNGPKLLNLYSIFSKKKTEKQIKNILINTINSKIIQYEQNIEIASALGLSNPYSIKQNNLYFVLNEPKNLYYQGEEALKIKLSHLLSLKNKLENFSLNYNPIADSATPAIGITNPPIFYSFFGGIFGVIVSLLIIFLRSLFSRKPSDM